MKSANSTERVTAMQAQLVHAVSADGETGSMNSATASLKHCSVGSANLNMASFLEKRGRVLD